MGESLQIKTAPTDNDGVFVALLDLLDDGLGESSVPGGVAGFFERQDGVEMMRNPGKLCGAGLGAADGHAAVDLEGVSVDDFAIECLGQSDGKRGLTGGSGAGEVEWRNGNWSGQESEI